jgi:F-type H+-transporting ATPase subunit a
MHAFLQIATPGGAGSDTLHVMGHRVVESPAGGTGEENLFIELLHHLRDANTIEVPIVGHLQLPQFPQLHVGGVLIDVSITKHVVFLWIAAAVLCVLLSYAARRNSKSSVPRGLGNLMEVFVEFVRDQIVVPTMNLLGLFPYGATATGNVSVTAGLAAIAFIMIQVAAIRSQGIGHYLAHLTGGVHWALWPIMIPIEIIGLFTKPFALCIRLFANMTAGHVVIASLFGLIFLYKSYVLAPGPVAFAVAINMLELFIAFLQAYIFVMLTALFMGLGMQTGHAPAHDEQHAREHHGH